MVSLATTADVRERASQWVQDGQSQLGILLGVLNDYDRLNDAAETAERECERLQKFVYENERLKNTLEATEHECKRLREDLSQVREELSLARAEAERHRGERQAIADSLAGFMNDILPRLRPEQA